MLLSFLRVLIAVCRYYAGVAAAQLTLQGFGRMVVAVRRMRHLRSATLVLRTQLERARWKRFAWGLRRVVVWVCRSVSEALRSVVFLRKFPKVSNATSSAGDVT